MVADLNANFVLDARRWPRSLRSARAQQGACDARNETSGRPNSGDRPLSSGNSSPSYSPAPPCTTVVLLLPPRSALLELLSHRRRQQPGRAALLAYPSTKINLPAVLQQKLNHHPCYVLEELVN